MRSILLAGMLITGGLAGLPVESEKALAADALTTPIPESSPFSCDVDCSEQSCDSGDHDAWDTTPAFYRWTRNGGAHQGGACFEGTCDTRHGPSCPIDGELPTNAEMELLRSSILAHDVARVEGILAAHPTRIRLNTTRSAVQLVNCKGAVTLHMPVPYSLTSSIAASTGVPLTN